MAFFVVQRDADSGLSIPLPESYPTREAAIAALSSATASGSLTLAGEVFIADLGTAVPVLMMAVPAGRAAEEAPVADVPGINVVNEEPELTPEPETLDEQAADEVYAAPLLGDEQSLAAALKRAASSLEDEGIVAPASIESAPEDAESAGPAGTEWPWANVEAYTVEEDPDPGEETESEIESAEPNAPAAEADPEPAADTIMPEVELGEPLAVEEPENAEQSADDTEVPVTELNAEEDQAEESPYLEAPAADVLEPLSIAGITDDLPMIPAVRPADDVVLPEDVPIITSAPVEGEDVYVPRPVILGDYADVVAPAGETATIAETQDAPDIDLGDVAEPVVGYEATGDVDFAENTCQDCVYANTCPKVGEAAPSNCGSFQWRAE